MIVKIGHEIWGPLEYELDFSRLEWNFPNRSICPIIDSSTKLTTALGRFVLKIQPVDFFRFWYSDRRRCTAIPQKVWSETILQKLRKIKVCKKVADSPCFFSYLGFSQFLQFCFAPYFLRYYLASSSVTTQKMKKIYRVHFENKPSQNQLSISSMSRLWDKSTDLENFTRAVKSPSHTPTIPQISWTI